MEAISFNYSLKNIPIPSKTSFIKSLVEKVESLIWRMRWKAYFFETNQEDDDYKEATNFGLKSDLTPPKNESLSSFENDMYNLIKTVKFKLAGNDFTTQLSKDLKSIEANEKIILFADKSTNLYKIEKDDYIKLLRENVTKTYKKAPIEAVKA